MNKIRDSIKEDKKTYPLEHKSRFMVDNHRIGKYSGFFDKMIAKREPKIVRVMDWEREIKMSQTKGG